MIAMIAWNTGSTEATLSQCLCNCPCNNPLPSEDSEIELTKRSEFVPIMEQIKQITGVMPIDVPPSEEAALQRIAEILDVPIELLVIEDGKAYLVDVTQAIVLGHNATRYPASSYGMLWNSYVLELKKFISVKQDLKQSILKRAYDKIISSIGYEGQMTKEYEFDTSDEAKGRRRNLAQQPWPDIREFTHVLEQIERITEVRPNTLPPNKNVALKRVADIFEIPVEILTFKEGKVHVIDMKSIKSDPSGINTPLKALCDRDHYYNWLITRNIDSLKGRYKDQLQRYLPVYSGYISPEQIKAASIQITSNVCNKWESQTKKFSPDAGVYLFDTSSEAQQRRREIAQKPWDE